jgi:hypothetical protein
MKISMVLFLILTTSVTKAEGVTDLKGVLERYKGATPMMARISLQGVSEQTLRHKSNVKEGSILLVVVKNDQGLHTSMPSQVEGKSAAGTRQPSAETSPDLPAQWLLQELGPDRVHHLLDQKEVILDLIGNGKCSEEKLETWEGKLVKVFEFTFLPQLSPTESFRLKSRNGHFILRTTEAGIPLQSEIKITFEGKTSRMFGRYMGTKQTETRYKVLMDHLIVLKCTEINHLSREDGSDITNSKQIYSVSTE